MGKLIELDDGVLVEVEVRSDQVQEVSGKMAEKVEATLDIIKPLLIKASKPVMEAWKELNKDGRVVNQAEVQFGLGFEGEGNVYITKAKASASLTVKLVFKPEE